MKKYLLILLAFWACNHSNHLEENLNKEKVVIDGLLHWSYQGESGPTHWAEIEKNSDCDGLHQSPVNIIEFNSQQGSEAELSLEIHYEDETKIHDVINNGHSIQYNFELGDYIKFQGKRYDLKQVHFHEPAEHTINGIRYPIEMHMVHTNEEGEITVLGILGEEGKNSAPFEFLEKYLPIPKDSKKIINAPFNLNLNLPEDHESFFFYTGSLTTPPCTENVNWILFRNSITLSLEQVKVLQELMPLNNYRNEQPLNERIILRSF